MFVCYVLKGCIAKDISKDTKRKYNIHNYCLSLIVVCVLSKQRQIVW